MTQTIAITGGRVVPIEGDPVDDGTVLVRDGKIAATSQQYPLKMAKEGVDAIVNYAKTHQKVHGYHDTGVTLIAKKAIAGVPSQSVSYGLAHCWG